MTTPAGKAPKQAVEAPAGLPAQLFRDQKAWAAWLQANHSASPGIWLRIAKKAADITSVSYAEALDTALCYGWIDGHKKSADESSYLQRFTPRAVRSTWSKINCAKALALIASGDMKAAGLHEIERAKKDGRWEAAYDSQRNIAIPDDLAAALAAAPHAQAFFAALDSQNRYAILFRLQTAKKAETRLKRLNTFIAMLERHETLHPVRKNQARQP
ncbi:MULTISPECIES: YdeI/OmpD-associated family protein [Polaromonas]|uniref:YdeI family protein n=1 Tax=Polaromonas aquatica TaxID=332657 RepID=A0ABW1TPV9_9BURK